MFAERILLSGNHTILSSNSMNSKCVYLHGKCDSWMLDRTNDALWNRFREVSDGSALCLGSWKTARSVGSWISWTLFVEVKNGVQNSFPPLVMHILWHRTRMHPKLFRFQASVVPLLQSLSTAFVHLPLFIARNEREIFSSRKSGGGSKLNPFDVKNERNLKPMNKLKAQTLETNELWLCIHVSSHLVLFA